MGLFTQEITLGLSKPSNVIEKEEIVLKKTKINLYVKKGSVVYVGTQAYKGSTDFYEIDASMLGGRKKDSVTVYITPDKTFDTMLIKFFAGKHKCSISYKPEAKADFSIIGEVEVMINDYQLLTETFDKTMTKEELVEELNNSYRQILGNEIGQAADRYITLQTTENDLAASINKIIKDVFSTGRKASSVFQKIGLVIVPSSISLQVQPLEDADEIMATILNKINEKAIASLDDEEKEREYQRKQTEIQAERDHEINLERAKHTSISEQKTEINNNGNGNVTIKQESKDRFCTNCGAKIPSGALFCPSCGTKQ